jgi:hypothetical protein
VANAQTITITVSGATDEFGQTLPTTDVQMGVLLGDATGDGVVNASDIAITKARIGPVVDAMNFRSDLNGDGAINAADVALTKSRSGTGLPDVTSVDAPDAHTQSLSLSDPGPLNGVTGQTFSISVNLTFSGYNAYGPSNWLEVPDALAPFLSVTGAVYFTFPTPNQTGPSPAPFNSIVGITAGNMRESRDLGAIVNDPSTETVPPGTYHINPHEYKTK